MNTVLSNYGQLCGCPEILKKSCKFFCRGLDIRVSKLVEAANDIWYDIVRCYGLRRSLFHRKGDFHGTKKQKTISDLQYRQEIKRLVNDIAQSDQQYQEAFRNAVHHYERFVYGEIGKEEFRAAQDSANEKKAIRDGIITSKEAYEKQYQVFRKLLKASRKEITLSQIMDCIDEIIICSDKNITVKWAIEF